MPAAIRVENLGKCYTLGQGAKSARYQTLRESLTTLPREWWRRWRQRAASSGSELFWALKGVNFEVQPGEVLGIIGGNGAGKSTLLKIFAQITKPTTGQVRLRGRVGSLLEVGTGFHPELTGRENIYLNGAILGMSRREIARKFDDIVSFAGVEQFLDTPVKRYSSGMYVRLAFAVAANIEPEILLVDEVLAVGDQAFQKKCVGRMGQIAASGRTVILVSHDLTMLSRLSTEVLWLSGGQLQQVGPPAEVIAAYCRQVGAASRQGSTTDLTRHPGRRLGGQPLLRRLSLSEPDGAATATVPLGGSLVVEVDVELGAGRSDTTVSVDVCDLFGSTLTQLHSQVQSDLDLTGVGTGTVRCRIDDLPLVPGEYTLTVAIGDAEDYLDRVEQALTFTVLPADVYGTGRVPTRRTGLVALSAHWELAPSVSEGASGRVPLGLGKKG